MTELAQNGKPGPVPGCFILVEREFEMNDMIRQIVSGIAPQVREQLPPEITGNVGQMEDMLGGIASMAVPELKKKLEDPVTHAGDLKTLFGFMQEAGGKKHIRTDGTRQADLLQALFGDQQAPVSGLAQKSGLDNRTAGCLLSVAIPFILAFLGKNLKEKNGLRTLMSLLGVQNDSLLQNAGSLLGLMDGSQSPLGALKGVIGGKLF